MSNLEYFNFMQELPSTSLQANNGTDAPETTPQAADVKLGGSKGESGRSTSKESKKSDNQLKGMDVEGRQAREEPPPKSKPDHVTEATGGRGREREDRDRDRERDRERERERGKARDRDRARDSDRERDREESERDKVRDRSYRAKDRTKDSGQFETSVFAG